MGNTKITLIKLWEIDEAQNCYQLPSFYFLFWESWLIGEPRRQAKISGSSIFFSPFCLRARLLASDNSDLEIWSHFIGSTEVVLSNNWRQTRLLSFRFEDAGLRGPNVRLRATASIYFFGRAHKAHTFIIYFPCSLYYEPPPSLPSLLDSYTAWPAN